MAAGHTAPDTSAMTAATSRIRFRPVVKAARVIIPTAVLACSGSRAITFPDLPGLHRRGDLRDNSPGTAATGASTCARADQAPADRYAPPGTSGLLAGWPFAL
jgi:hypothetical protein